MARRRLLTLLAASALLTGAFAGPAAALDLDEATAVAPVDVAETTEEVAEPIAEVVTTPEVVEETAAVAPVTEIVTPTPAAQPRSQPAAPTPAPSNGTSTTPKDDVVAAGAVTAAPPIDLLISLGGSEPTPTRGTSARLDTPGVASAEPSVDEVMAPQVAPAPAPLSAPVSATSPSVLAQSLDGLPEQSAPALALVALAALLAAGAGTVQTARVETAL